MADVKVMSATTSCNLKENAENIGDFEEIKNHENTRELQIKLAGLNAHDVMGAKTTLSSSENADDDDDDDEDDESDCDLKPSPMLKIIIEKHEAIEKTVSLIKKGITVDEDKRESEATIAAAPKTPADLKLAAAAKPVKEEFDQLNNLLSDNKVQNMIRNVGVDTQSVIDRAMRAINSSKSLEEKRNAFSIGLRKLQMNLSTKSEQVNKDPNYNMAMNLVGLRK